MPAHLSPLHQKCRDCTKEATHEAFNAFNATLGFYCARCGCKEVKRIIAEDEVRVKYGEYTRKLERCTNRSEE
jgi:Zn finger protein HypA/HybF involved in hydrogenase expression